ncbi:MAG: hypothetical protein HOB63_08645 [Opitutae bacterium]|jgi:hypothetical protein|nr:hypothetical protein [Opitutae bacterium]MBT7741881.1 hypothetical protein [Opitutae bacterium]
MKKLILLPFFLFLFVLGCGMPSSGTHTIERDSDWFENDYNGRKVGCRNWVVTVDGKQIPIEKKKSVIKIEVSASDEIDVWVNGEKVHDE